ncbi:MAG: adenine phosphoribosyltransferase [Firmicutes bacterium]|nr:adenine phosphoribosyltransferase [Bacillota bacterium]
MEQKLTYPVNICGRVENLPVYRLSEVGISVAFFNLHGDAELTEFCAEKLAPLVSGADVILTAESKGLQLAHCVARNLGHRFYAVARKSKKIYLVDGISVQVQSITTAGTQTLYLSRRDSELLRGKKVAIVDDVISTGSSLKGLEALVELSGGIVYKKAAVLAEGDAASRDDIVFLATIPIL